MEKCPYCKREIAIEIKFIRFYTTEELKAKLFVDKKKKTEDGKKD